MTKQKPYQKKASDAFIARQKAAGKVRVTFWAKKCPELLRQLKALIENYKG